MKTLLVITTGRTDVQIVKDGLRYTLDGDTCGLLQDAIMKRSWSLVPAPLGSRGTGRNVLKELPDGELTLCTPKLDAVIAYMTPDLPTSVLILETCREHASDPRHAGAFLERRLRDLGVQHITRVSYLTGKEYLEDPTNDLDAVVRGSVVAALSDAIARATADLKPGDRVLVAATGGLPAANELIKELVRLHCVGGPEVKLLDVPENIRAKGKAPAGQGNSDSGEDPAAAPERAVEEKFHPATGYQARWHALSLIENGNLLGAWGAVCHLERVPGQEWIRVVKWLADFASAKPPEDDCDLAVLLQPRMAVRAALRVELALRAGDIPRAVQGTMAFFEAALWDHLLERFERCDRANDPKLRRCFRLRDGAAPPDEELIRRDKDYSDDNRKRPFIRSVVGGIEGYRIDDSIICAIKLAQYYLKLDHLRTLGQTIDRCRINDLRNDAAHNEPTADLMEKAPACMQTAGLWSNSSPARFLTQPLIQNVLEELGVARPEFLLTNLLDEVRRRLVASPTP